MSETLTDEELNAYAAGDFRPKSFFSVEFPDAVQSIASELCSDLDRTSLALGCRCAEALSRPDEASGAGRFHHRSGASASSALR